MAGLGLGGHARRGAFGDLLGGRRQAQAKPAAFELRHVGTDLSRAQCNYLMADWCSPALVGTLTLELPCVPVGP